MLQLYVVYVPCARGTYMYHGGAEFFVAPLYMELYGEFLRGTENRGAD
jgi:hypothetical protein